MTPRHVGGPLDLQRRQPDGGISFQHAVAGDVEEREHARL
jgi:hypothetical protein